MAVCSTKEEVVAHFKSLADKHKCTVSQLALAWLLKQGDDVILILGDEAHRVSRAELGEHEKKAERRGRKGNSRVCERCGGGGDSAASIVLRLSVLRYDRTADYRILRPCSALISQKAILCDS